MPHDNTITKMELIVDTQPELICCHKDETHMPSQRRVLRYQCHTDYGIQLGNHWIITCYGTRVKHKKLIDYMNSKHSSFPSSFTKPFIIQRYSQASQSLQTHFLSKDFVSILPIIKASLNFANNAINPSNPFSRI